MAGAPLDILNSITGTRLMIWVYDVETVLSNQTGIDYTLRPWGTAEQFDDVYFSSGGLTALPLPCSQSEFKFGSDAYTSTGDALPSVVRVKMQRMGPYEQSLTFPLLVTGEDNPLSQSYPVINNFLKNSRSQPLTAIGTYSPDIGMNMICVQDSFQKNPLPYILDSFSINANGVGQASPVQCSINLKGIGGYLGVLTDGRLFQYPSRNPLDANTSYSSDKSGPDPSVLTEADVGSARVANIKDCWVSLGTSLSNKIQVVNMDLNIKHTLDFRSTSGYTPPPIIGSGGSFITDDHVYMSARMVSGSFTFLASSAIDPNTGDQNTRYSPFYVSKGETLTRDQWSSPMTMNFGPLTFSMPATYWQPSSHRLSSGSTVYTIRFIARTIDPYGNREML